MKYLLHLILFLFVSPVLFAQNIYTLAGTGSAGGNDGLNGPAISATLNSPYSVKVDKKGNVYIADYNNQMVKRVSIDGIITAFAGTGNLDAVPDTAVAMNTTINAPRGLFIDSTGNVYISLFSDYTIRKVDTNGIITRYCGRYDPDNKYNEDNGDGGPALAAKITSPSGMVTDKQGNLYFTQLDFKVRKVDTDGIITQFAGAGYGYDGDGGFATDALFNQLNDIAIDNAGNIYLADVVNNVIRKIRPSGIVSTFAGTGVPGYSGDGADPRLAELNRPAGITIDSIGQFYIADFGNNVIRKISADGSVITTIAGTGVAGYSGDGGDPLNATLNRPISVAVSGDYIYISELRNNIIRYIGPPRSTLPLQLLSFTGNVSGGKAILQWLSTQEINLSRFELESGTDGVNFKTINTTNAVNSTGNNTYNYTDASFTNNGTTYVFYRLKMIDNDARVKYSSILRLALPVKEFSVEVLSNPVHQTLNIQVNTIKEEKHQLTILDITGKQLMTTNYILPVGKSIVALPVDKFASGVYVLVSQSASGERKTIKFVKH